MSESVAIFGAGVAGLTAAHELAERGYRVTVFEPRRTFGGKARSIDVPRSGRGGREPLPGEHGFRLFPGFYRHISDTMSRIPYGSNRRGVLDNLVSVERTLFARSGQRSLRFPVHAPNDRLDIAAWVAALVDATEARIPPSDCAFFVRRLLVLLTSCDMRREKELEQISWWDFVEASARSANYQKYLAGGLTRALVAMKAEEGSARTLGMILQALMLDTVVPGRCSDRVLNGPTNVVWIDPWVAHLRSMGVSFRTASLLRLQTDERRVTGAMITDGRGKCPIAANHYIAALPHEVLNGILTDDNRRHAPSLRGLGRLRTEWMNGIQLYLDRDVPLIEGHSILVDSPWALTAISQRQFWAGFDWQGHGDGRVRGILSVDISEWGQPGPLFGKPARRCSPSEVRDEVWAQLKAHLNVGGTEVLHDDSVLEWFLDPALIFEDGREVRNSEPLLVNTVDSWQHRPEAQTALENLYLAGDYVRTHTDLATMESANEAARRACNAIIARSQRKPCVCDVWRLPEPTILAPLRELDARRFARGEPHLWYRNGSTTFDALPAEGAWLDAMHAGDARANETRLTLPREEIHEMNHDYVFLERWTVPAPAEAIYEALADFDLYPRWGYPSYVFGRRDGPLQVGCTGKLVVRGALPYELNLDCTITRLEQGRQVEMSVDGDLLGRSIFTMLPLGENVTELRSDWRCNAKWAAIRAFTPVLRPMFRWNHERCANAAIAGLAQYLSRRSTPSMPETRVPRAAAKAPAAQRGKATTTPSARARPRSSAPQRKDIGP